MRTNFNTLYKSQGFFWDIDDNGFYVHTANVHGPYCPNCKMDIIFPSIAFKK